MTFFTKKSRHYSGQDLKDIQQPLGKDGWSNPDFDKLYPNSKNPFRGTERDIKNKKVRVFFQE